MCVEDGSPRNCAAFRPVASGAPHGRCQSIPAEVHRRSIAGPGTPSLELRPSRADLRSVVSDIRSGRRRCRRVLTRYLLFDASLRGTAIASTKSMGQMSMFVFSPENAIAVARCTKEPFSVRDDDSSMPVPNVAGVLQYESTGGDGGSRDPEDPSE